MGKLLLLGLAGSGLLMLLILQAALPGGESQRPQYEGANEVYLRVENLT